MAAVAAAGTAKSAGVSAQGLERMLDVRLADLLDAVVVGREAAHSIKVLGNYRVIVARELKPVKIDGAGIARIGTDGQADLRSRTVAILCHLVYVANDDIRAGDGP